MHTLAIGGFMEAGYIILCHVNINFAVIILPFFCLECAVKICNLIGCNIDQES
jgi:hypothetical protein